MIISKQKLNTLHIERKHRSWWEVQRDRIRKEHSFTVSNKPQLEYNGFFAPIDPLLLCKLQNRGKPLIKISGRPSSQHPIFQMQINGFCDQ